MFCTRNRPTDPILNDCLTFSCYPLVIDYAPEGELFDEVVKELEEETLMNEVKNTSNKYTQSD